MPGTWPRPRQASDSWLAPPAPVSSRHVCGGQSLGRGQPHMGWRSVRQVLRAPGCRGSGCGQGRGTGPMRHLGLRLPHKGARDRGRAGGPWPSGWAALQALSSLGTLLAPTLPWPQPGPPALRPDHCLPRPCMCVCVCVSQPCRRVCVCVCVCVCV